jgi:hypothetical protein
MKKQQYISLKIRSSLRRILFLKFIILLFSYNICLGQLNLEWTSPNREIGTAMGWVTWYKFPIVGSFVSEQHFYIQDENQIQYMQDGSYNLIPEYTYTFSQEEKNAGPYLYCIYYDFNSDNFPEFSIGKAYGTTYPFRYAFRIFDLNTNITVVEFDNSAYSYNNNGLTDIDGDGVIELIVRKEDFPSTGNYELEVYNTGISSTDISGDTKDVLPENIHLNQNFPNPFNPVTTISYTLNSASHVQIIIYDVQGRIIKKLVDEKKTGGVHDIEWNGTNEFNVKVASGTYFYKLTVDNIRISKKMILVK